MYANYHTHTKRCNHATGEMCEYVEEAIKSGKKILGFSDHSPYIFDGGYYSTFRMTPQETEQYVKDIDKLREEYKNDIKIYTGFELEYYPTFFEGTIKFLKQFDYDYLILGQHALNDEYNGAYTYNAMTTADDLILYVKQTIEAMETGEFLYLAHPDVIYFHEDLVLYKQEMEKLCIRAKELSIPLEINLLGMSDNRLYPFDAFWEIAKKVGNDVVLGCDAHSPKALNNKEVEKKAVEYASKFGFTPLKELKVGE